MPVKFEYIDSFLEDEGLQNPELKTLVPDAGLYKTIVYQHEGEVEASIEEEIYIRNIKRELTISKFDSFFNKAIEEGVQLAITPEYSCPWDSVGKLIEQNKLPEDGNLWVVGCESITPEEFRQFVDDYKDKSITMIYEKDAFDSNEKKFLDPIIYLFKSKAIGSELFKDVMVFQFKTHPMGNAFQYEADNMLRGTKRFIIRNNISSIWLFTIICSESLVFSTTQDDLNFNNQPYLILHLQLNNSARTPNFIEYRTTLYNRSKDPVKDLICLNWARGSKLMGPLIENSSSAIYIKSDAVTNEIEDKKICLNDNLGLHYHFWKEARTGLFIFNYDESIFLYENFKASQRPEVAQLDRTRRGPKMLKTWKWCNNKWGECNCIDNTELKNSCDKLEIEIDFLLSEDLSSVNRERFLSLSTGHIISSDWTHPSKNELFTISNNERSNRLAMFQDTKTVNYKEKLLSQLMSLEHQFQSSDNIPDDCQMTDLKDGCRFEYKKDNLSYNVVGNRDIPACLVWAGDMPQYKAKELKDVIIKSINDNETNNSKRILIWYNHGTLRTEYDPAPPKSSDNPSQSPLHHTKKRWNND